MPIRTDRHGLRRAAFCWLLAAGAPDAGRLELRGDDLQFAANCAARDVLIEGSRGSFRLHGGCRSITLRGNLAVVQAELEPGGRLLIEGGGNLVVYALARPGGPPTVTIRGEDSRVRRQARLDP